EEMMLRANADIVRPSTSSCKLGDGEPGDMTNKLLKLKRRATELLETAFTETASTLKKARLSLPPDLSSHSLITSDLQKRLSSFNALNWSVKPTEISVDRFAVHGWICTRGDILHCEGCGRYLDASLPSLLSVSSDAFRRAISRLNSMAVDGHESTCHFRCSISADDSIGNTDDYCKEMRNRASELEQLNLRDVNIEPFTPLTEDICAKLGIFDGKAAALACCGWTKSEVLADAIECGYCGRTLGLWMFRDHSMLNPERQHHAWCRIVTVPDCCISDRLAHRGSTVDQSPNQKGPLTFEVIAKGRMLKDAVAKSATHFNSSIAVDNSMSQSTQ
uniref:C3HC-type domain-containing protein n=2 Tax=Parascaris univalens TaxID=6257 RepID=A0A914ZWS4_PARUN